MALQPLIMNLGAPVWLVTFRTFESETSEGVRGYHKPIMIAGGFGNIREDHVDKPPFDAGAKLVVLGGPAMLIGLGGGAASSMASGTSSEDLDFASVQRQNPEMQRRCQEVIDRCWETWRRQSHSLYPRRRCWRFEQRFPRVG